MSYQKWSQFQESEDDLFDSAAMDILSAKIQPVQPSVFDAVKNVPIVLVGEASHGTKEFYDYRCELTKQLIETGRCKGVCIEGNWPDCSLLHAYVTHLSPNLTLDDALSGFRSFPTWMWRNEAMKEFIVWLHAYNSKKNDAKDMCGIWGLDIYSLDTSISAVINFVSKHDPKNVAALKDYYDCFERVGQGDPQRYGMMTALMGNVGCQVEFKRALQDVVDNSESFITSNVADDHMHTKTHVRDLAFINEQNARVVVDAEAYYRSMYTESSLQKDEEGKQFLPKSSWEIRDTHFFETLEHIRNHLLETRGDNGVVVWAHNSHLGDARYVYAGTKREAELGLSKELNIGQLVKQRYPDSSIRY